MSRLLSLFQPLLTHKYLLYQLTQREIKVRYKQSVIGYFWVLLNPLAQMLIYTFVFSVVFKFPTNNVPYQVFLFAALLPWTFMQTTLMSATQSLVSNAVLLKKVAFPREIIPYSVVLSKVIDFLFASLVFLGLIIWFRVTPAPTAWLYIPLFLAQLLLTTGLSLMLASFNLFYRDIQYLANLVIMVWFYLTPIVYPVSLVPEEYLFLYKLNPLVGIVESYRAVLFGYPLEPKLIMWSVGFSILTFLIGFIVFKKGERVFSDVV